MNHLYILLLCAAFASAGQPVRGVPGQSHDQTISKAIAAHQIPGMAPPVSAGYDGEGAGLSGWTQSGPNRQTRPGILDGARTAGAEIDQRKVSAGISHEPERSGGHAWAKGPKTKVSARIEAGGAAHLTVTQPNGQVHNEQIDGRERRIRMSRSKLAPVVDNKQTRTFTSNTPGKQVHVKAQFVHGKGNIKAKAWQR